MNNILAAFVILNFCVIGLGIRVFFKKNGQFRGSCSGMNITGDKECLVCGKKADEMDCKKFNR